MTAQEKILNKVLKAGGELVFTEFKGIECAPFVKLRAVKFTEDYDESGEVDDIEDDPDNWNWNKFCDRVHKAIGAGYCHWVGWSKDMKGIIAAYDKDENEVKLKYFEDYKYNWEKLLKHISK